MCSDCNSFLDMLHVRACSHGERVTLRGGLPSSIVFPGFIYMPGRVTLGGLTFCRVKGRGRVTLLRGLSFRISDYCHIRAIYENKMLVSRGSSRDNTPLVKGGYFLTLLERATLVAA